MNASDYRRLLDGAVTSEYGLRLQLPASHLRGARQVRRRLYLARERARASGDRSLDSLSVMLRYERARPAPWEVWIVRCDRLPRVPPLDDGVELRTEALMPAELPREIRARGRDRRRRAFRWDTL